MKRNLATIIASLIPIIITIIILIPSGKKTDDQLEILRQRYSTERKSPVDHSKFEILQKEFKDAHEVTEACISCHNKRDEEVMQTAHWNWEKAQYIEGRGLVFLGKKNIYNNCCISVSGSEDACMRCHAGYGWDSPEFDFTESRNIDCLVCHDNSGEYFKGAGMAGYPDPSVDLNQVSQQVGVPQKENCGACHFYSGGGNNVKHGDLEEAILTATREVDVHMAATGINMKCTDCHQTENHHMSGKLYTVSSMNRDRANCEQCHTSTPHANEVINEHSLKVSCQACHIPTYAKVNSTKTAWDWSTAGKLKNGEPYHVEDSLGNHTYLSIKGTFEWGRNLEPEYAWFNGTADHYFYGDPVDTTKEIEVNTLNGNYKDHNSKIIPVKIIRGKQIFDPVNMAIIKPKLYDEDKGDSAYWKDFDWDLAAEAGMREAGLPYSGEYSFARTKMYWPVNHMVSPVEETLSCTECHSRKESRIAGLTDFYIPGRDYSAAVDNGGLLLILLTLIGVISHGLYRIISSKRN